MNTTEIAAGFVGCHGEPELGKQLTGLLEWVRRRTVEECVEIALFEQNYWREREAAGQFAAENIEFNLRKLLK